MTEEVGTGVGVAVGRTSSVIFSIDSVVMSDSDVLFNYKDSAAWVIPTVIAMN
ncbi:MAG: hypothetical protein LUQ50_00095 [Methanospirillum sp.]|uniref:hypothetical protein n=1 Tax=Methanospirillum sp. TaxID=45200 RepID=UPI0023725A0D|nr:hypothetical protein [Methanospirillum sp.]MDD1727450.1 hypothetical protein [Methanospirillum sp.]